MTKNFDFVKFFKKSLIISAAIMIAGIISTIIFGVKLDIDFSGGSRFTYSYTGDVNTSTVETTLKDALGVNADVTLSSDVSGSSKKLVITYSEDVTKKIDKTTLETILKEALAAETEESESAETESAETTEEESGEISTETMVDIQTAVTHILNSNFKDNTFKLSQSNTVNPSLADSFFAKALVAVALSMIFVILYVGIRFRKIGGITAGVSALIALLHDVVIAFFTCVVFGLELDTNFFAVILTLFGYSLNDTIVIFDRVRENKKLYPALSIREQVNKSVNETLSRSILTSLTTFSAIMSIVLVAEFFGVTTLRSFAIPMAVGILSGCYSSVFLSGPFWVVWSEHRSKAKKK